MPSTASQPGSECLCGNPDCATPIFSNYARLYNRLASFPNIARTVAAPLTRRQDPIGNVYDDFAASLNYGFSWAGIRALKFDHEHWTKFTTMWADIAVAREKDVLCRA